MAETRAFLCPLTKMAHQTCYHVEGRIELIERGSERAECADELEALALKYRRVPESIVDRCIAETLEALAAKWRGEGGGR